MSSQIIAYKIVNKEKYCPNEGEIESIYHKDGKGFKISIDERISKFSFMVRLKCKAFISIIEVQALHTNMISFELIGQNKKVHHSINYIFRQQSQGTILAVKDARRHQTVRIKITLSNLYANNSGILGLRYLLFKGEAQRKEKQPTIIYLNDDSEDEVQNKLKESKIKGGKVAYVTGKRPIQNEEQQLKKAIELSKKEAEKMKPSKEKEMRRNGKFKELAPVEEWSINNQSKPREYALMDYNKYKEIFKYVNSEWMEAQKKAEIKLGVAQNERLSNLIVMRVFENKTIFLDIADKQQKKQLQLLCTEMGAKVKKNLQDNCLFITERKDTQKVVKSSKLKGVKILRSSFITECRACQAYLDEKEYFFTS